MTKKIKFSLSAESIDQAISQLDAYIEGIKKKTEQLRDKVAERIQWSAQEGFSNAIADDIIRNGETEYGGVEVTLENNGDITVVIANGENAVFIEFGAGVYHNGASGQSPHPKGEEKGFLIGEYGKGMGKKKAWALPGASGDEAVITRGTPAAMPMYRGVQEAVSVIGELAKEVFG